MKYYTMYHSELKWGGPVPVLMAHKRQATMGTGMTLGRIRELGWQWITVEVSVPDVITAAERIEQIDNEVAHLLQERQEIERKWISSQ